jgi:endonuclease/exonuclease/phosphatase family metal-dependent hydrolase
VLYGNKVNDRLGELEGIAVWQKKWAADMHAFDQSLIVLGDFNIERKGDPRYEAFTSTGLRVPTDLETLRRTVFDRNSTYYTQIAWFESKDNIPELSIKYLRGGVFNFGPHVLKNKGLSPFQLSWRISDHLPLWAEFSTRC